MPTLESQIILLHSPHFGGHKRVNFFETLGIVEELWNHDSLAELLSEKKEFAHQRHVLIVDEDLLPFVDEEAEELLNEARRVLPGLSIIGVAASYIEVGFGDHNIRAGDKPEEILALVRSLL